MSMKSTTYDTYPQNAVDNPFRYAGYWPVCWEGDGLTPLFAQSAGAATAAPPQLSPSP